jgi:nucleoside-diphosphate-sugar epimerase
MSNWLVTGGHGFVGSHLVENLGCDRPAHVSTLLTPTRHELELTDGEAVAAFIRRHEVTAIVHLASSLQRSNTVEAERRQWRDTFEAGRTLLGQAAAGGVRHVIVSGSIEELGDHEGVLGVELPSRPHSTYSLCKSLLREYAGFVSRTARVRIDWFRPFVVYGPGQVGEMLIPSAFRAAVSSEPCDFSDGLQRRDFLFVDDLVRWIRLATGFRPDTAQFRVHHLGSGTAVPVREALDVIREEFPGAPFRIGARSRRPGEPMLQQAPPYSIDEPGVASWQPLVGLREGLRRTAAWWRTTIHS